LRIQRLRKGGGVGVEGEGEEGFQERGTRRRREEHWARIIDWSWAVMIDGVEGS
jgi:hypothetical protein